jgi:hypothetical protein
LAAEGDRRARHALAGLRELTIMLAGAQLGITMCSLGLGAVAEPAVARIIESALGEWFTLSDTASHVIAFTIALSIVVFLHMVVAEMAPKSWAIAHPEKSSLLLARPFRLFALVFRPVILLLNGLANGVVRLVGVEPQDERAMAHSPSDLLLLIEESAGRGGIAAEEHELLARSLELSGLTAADAMTPRRDIVAVAATATAERAGRGGPSHRSHPGDRPRGGPRPRARLRPRQGRDPPRTGHVADHDRRLDGRPIMVTPDTTVSKICCSRCARNGTTSRSSSTSTDWCSDSSRSKT